jgi:hypothetical protein
MLSLAELKKQPILDDNDILIRFVIDTLYVAKTSEEYLIADKRGGNKQQYSISDYRYFWYSHLYKGGCYNYALSIDMPSFEDKTWVQIMPARYLDKDGKWALVAKSKKFDIRKPDNNDLKDFVRSTLDIVKKYQGRGPWGPA